MTDERFEQGLSVGLRTLAEPTRPAYLGEIVAAVAVVPQDGAVVGARVAGPWRRALATVLFAAAAIGVVVWLALPGGKGTNVGVAASPSPRPLPTMSALAPAGPGLVDVHRIGYDRLVIDQGGSTVDVYYTAYPDCEALDRVQVISEIAPIRVKVYIGTVPGVVCPTERAQYMTTVTPTDRVATGGVTPTTSPGVDASPSPVPAPSTTPPPTTPWPTWLSGQAFMDALTSAEGYSWVPGKARGSMTAIADGDATIGHGDATISVSPPLDGTAQVLIVERDTEVPTNGAFEAAVRVVSPDAVGWLDVAYRELAPYPEKVTESIDVTGGTVNVSHEVRDGTTVWTMTLRPWDPVDPEQFPGEVPLG